MKRWKLTKEVFGDKIEYTLYDTKLGFMVDTSLTNWMLIDIFTTVGGVDKVEFENEALEQEIMDYLDWEKERARAGL